MTEGVNPNFSSRLSWASGPNALARLHSSKAHLGVPLLDLTQSNPTTSGLVFPATLSGALDHPDVMFYEPAPRGLPAARQAVADYYAAKGAAVASDDVVLTCSSSEAYTNLFRLLTDPGDEVLVPRPGYPLFDDLAALESVVPVTYPAVYDQRWRIDTDALAAAVSARTRAIVAVNPNNPTGAWLTGEAWDAICSICVTHNLVAIVDEVFADFAIDPPADSLATVAGQSPMPTFVISGLSKVAALPQMKLGWIAVCGPPTARVAAIDGLEVIADTFLSVSTPVQLALPLLLEARHDLQAQILSRLRFNLASLAAAVDGSAVEVLTVEGGWYAIVRMPDRHTDEDWALRLLAEQDVLMHPGFLFDFAEDHCLVCSLLTPQSEFAAGVTRLMNLIASDCPSASQR